MRVISHGPFVPLADVEQRLAATPGTLGELYRRVLRETGVLPAPPGTARREVTIALDDAPGSMNRNELRSGWKGYDAAKRRWQGWLMRELDGLDLDRPIRSVGADGKTRAPILAHAVVTTPGGTVADSENLRTLLAKALGDALVGPLWRWEGEGKSRQFVPADRSMLVEHARYVAGWLDADTDADWLLVFEVRRGPPGTHIRFVWDEPARGR